MLTRRALLPFLALLACSRSASPAPTAPVVPDSPPPAAPSGSTGASITPPHADPVLPPIEPGSEVKEALEIPPGDPPTPRALSPDRETVVDPGATFRVVLAGSCRDGRLLLLDASGAAVAASETSVVGATSVLTLAPAAALTPGSRYQLRLDGATGRELHVADQRYEPSRYALRAAGDPPPPAPKARPHAKVKRSRRH